MQSTSLALPERTIMALGFVERGWRIVPCAGVRRDGRCTCRRASCSRPGKHPVSTGWQAAATTDPGVIRQMTAKPGNIGIATGVQSGIVVIDVDGADGLRTLADLLQDHPDIDQTYTVETGSGGRHLYFRHPGRMIANDVRILPGIDIRGDGGLVIAPPSQHTSGGQYAVLTDLPVADFPDAFGRVLKSACKSQRLGATQVPRSKPKSLPTTDAPPACVLPTSCLSTAYVYEAIEATVPSVASTRNRGIFEFARWLKSMEGIDPDMAPSPRLLPYVRQWHDRLTEISRLEGFTVKGTLLDTMADFCHCWPRIKCTRGDSLSGAVDRAKRHIADGLTEPVRSAAEVFGASNELIALLAVCYELHKFWDGLGFHLGCRTAAKSVEGVTSQPRCFKWANVQLNLLVKVGVLRFINQVKPGGTCDVASSYLWTWDGGAQ